MKAKCVKKHGKNQLCYGCVVKYQNPDKRCGYPPVRDEKEKTWSPAGCCWGYASAVDAGTVKKFVKKSCPGCDLWDEGKPRPGGRE